MAGSSNTRQLEYWWAVASALGDEATQDQLRALMTDHVDAIDVPRVVLDQRSTVRDVLRAAPGLETKMVLPDVESDADADQRIAIMKSIVNVFGGHGSEQISAETYSDWLEDVRHFESACGHAPGGLLQGRGAGTGGGRPVADGDVGEAVAEISKGRGLMSEPDIRAGLRTAEKSMIDRMALAEVLNDSKLAAEITPSMAMVSELLRQKGGLSGVALTNAKSIIRRHVEELRDILARKVETTTSGRVDHSVPPKRVFSNLDLKRTIWSNLTNYDPDEEQLYVDRLYYKHTAKQVNKHRMIVVVDQSGSMVPAMVNCTILASIFAGLRAVEGHLIAYDTEAMDLSPWVDDPFEVLLRTDLGGGTDGMCAAPLLADMVTDPSRTVVAWVSDFYDNRDLVPFFRGLVRSGVTFIPVGSVSTSGYFSVDSWFRRELKQLGTPILSGSLKTLIQELKTALP